jgi:hypothetical protein
MSLETQDGNGITVGGHSAGAHIAGVDLGIHEADVTAGAAFRVAGDVSPPSRISDGAVADQAVNGHLVRVHEAEQQAIIRVKGKTLGPDDVMREAHAVAQKGLDFLAVQGRGAFSLPRAHEEHVVWWRERGETTLRVVVSHPVRVSTSATATVTRGGKVVPPPTPRSSQWDPALRYYRLSQLAEDMFEAYRNGFLALEAMLSRAVSGGPARGDRAWLRYALQEVGQTTNIDLRRYLSQSSAADPVEQFIHEQYEARRCAIFHAKAHRRPLLPGSANERDHVVSALEPLLRLILDLSDRVLNLRFPSGVMTIGGFELMVIGTLVSRGITLGVANDPSALRQTQTAAGLDGLAHTELATRHLGRLDAAGREHGFLGETRDVPDFAFNSIFSYVNGELCSRHALPDLCAAGVDRVQVLIRWFLDNRQTPKSRFSL